MDFVEGVTNYGDAPVFSVDGLASIDRISPNKLRIGYFVWSKVGTKFVKKLVFSVDWDIEIWIATLHAAGLAEPDIASAGVLVGPVGRRQLSKH